MNNYKRLLCLSTLIGLLSLASYGENKDPLSNIDMKISLKKSYIENIINKELPTTITDNGSGTEFFKSKNNLLSIGMNLLGAVDKKYAQKFRWSYSITRGDIAFDAKGQNIQGIAPYTGTLQAQWDANNNVVDANLSGTAGINSNIVINQNWEIIPDSTPIFTISNSSFPLNLNIYGMDFKTNININDSIQKKIVQNLQKATDILDEKIKSFDLRSLVQEQWQKLKDPILVNKDYNLWLTVNPQSASYSNIISDKDDLGLKIGTDVYLHLYFGEKPQELALNQLPPMNFGNVDDSFTINLPITGTYDALNEQLYKNLNNKEISLPLDTKVTVENPKINSENNLLKLDSDMSFSILGLFHPKAKVVATINPQYNSETSSFEKSTFDYNIITDSFLLKVINFVGHRFIKNKVQEQLFSLKADSYLTTFKDILQKTIGQYPMDNKAILKTQITSLKLNNISVEPQSLSITIGITGSSVLEVLNPETK